MVSSKRCLAFSGKSSLNSKLEIQWLEFKAIYQILCRKRILEEKTGANADIKKNICSPNSIFHNFKLFFDDCFIVYYCIIYDYLWDFPISFAIYFAIVYCLLLFVTVLELN